MKKSTQTNLIALPNIGTIQIHRIAKAAKSTPRYARMVLKGQRDSHSNKAKAIVRGAKRLDAKLEQVYNSIERKITAEID